MIVNIPTQANQAAWSQRTTLDGTDYQLDFVWNARDGAWYLSIGDTFSNVLLSGLKLVSNRPLLRRFHHIVGLPPGEISAVSFDGSIDYAQYADLGVSVLVYYFDASEVANALA